MNAEEIKEFIDENVKYLNWQFHVGTKGEAIYLQIRFMAPNNYCPEVFELQYCRKWQLSIWMTQTEIVQSCWAAVQRAVMHEASEQFRYKNKDIFNTHIAVDKLVELLDGPEPLEHRTDPHPTTRDAIMAVHTLFPEGYEEI